MRFALEGRFGAAAVAIAVAAAIDGLDGRLARLLKATSRFGAEFDSLADFLCFGVAPAFVLYLWSLQRAGAFRLHALPDVRGLHGAAAGALQRRAGWRARPGLRLQLLHRRARAGRRRAGAVSAVPRAGGADRSAGTGCCSVSAVSRCSAPCVLVGTALLLVSTLPVWSFKNFKVPAEYVLPLLLGTGIFAALLVADPWAALAAGGLIYLGMLPFSVRSFRRLKREAEEYRRSGTLLEGPEELTVHDLSGNRHRNGGNSAQVGVTVSRSRRPARSTSHAAGWPARSPRNSRCRSSTPPTGTPSNATITSPTCRPAAFAGPCSSTPVTSTPVACASPCRRRSRAPAARSARPAPAGRAARARRASAASPPRSPCRCRWRSKCPAPARSSPC